MGASGFAIVDFGAAFTDRATLLIAEAGVIATSRCEAFLDATAAATADHSPDEHVYSEIDVLCQDLVAGVGFNAVLRARGPWMYYGKYNIIWIWL